MKGPSATSARAFLRLLVRVGTHARSVAVAVALSLALLVPANALMLGPFASLVVRLGGTAAFSDFLLLSAAAVGTAIAFVQFPSSPNSTTDGIQVQIATDAPLPTPSGWSPSSGAPGTGGKPIPPGTTSPIAPGGQTIARTYSDGWRSTYGLNSGCEGQEDAAAVALCAAQSRGCSSATITNLHHTGSDSRYDVIIGGSQTCAWGSGPTYLADALVRQWALCPSGYTVNSADYSQCVNNVPVCPTGYTMNGSVCQLSSPNDVRWPSDGVCQIVRSGNSYAYATQDPDCDNPTSQVSINGGTVSVTASDGSSGSVVTNSDGTSQVKNSVPNRETNTTTTHYVIVSTPTNVNNNSTVTITGSGQNVTPGIGTANDPNTNLPQFDTSGLATEATLAATKSSIDSLKGSVDALKGQQCGGPDQPPCKVDETGTPTDSSLSAQKDSHDAAWTARIAALEGSANVSNLGLGLTIDWPVSGCSNPSFSIPGMHGRSLVVNMCEYQADIKSAFGWLVAVLTAMGLFSIGVNAIRGV